MLMEGSDFAKKIHVTDLATHVGYMPENPYDPKYEEVLVACKAIVEKCKENGQNFLFETGQETPVTLKRSRILRKLSEKEMWELTLILQT